MTVSGRVVKLPGKDGEGAPQIIREGIPWLKPQLWRPPGLHVSGIIHDICVGLGHYEDSGPSDWSAADRTRMELGCALEDAIVQRYAEHYPDKYLQIGAVEADDIWGTPDLIDLDDWAVEEIKLTWLSSRWDWDSQKFWKFWRQLMAYCWIVKSRVGRLHVCNINGDYKYGKGDGGKPQYRVWEQVWTVAELRQNWEMLSRHGNKYYDKIVEG